MSGTAGFQKTNVPEEEPKDLYENVAIKELIRLWHNDELSAPEAMKRISYIVDPPKCQYEDCDEPAEFSVDDTLLCGEHVLMSIDDDKLHAVRKLG